MNRYLLYVSYIGTQFRGVQKNINLKEPFRLDASTIQGALEMAVYKLRPLNPICVVPSSRTDAGVHALSSTFHVDLLSAKGKPYDTTNVTTVVNKFFRVNDLNVRVSETKIVPKEFHCRYHAASRTYFYRIAVVRKQYWECTNTHLYHIPIEEYGRCYFIL